MHHASKATSKHGKRLRFGMLTVLRNIRSTKMLHPASCMMHDGGRRPSVEDDLWWKMTFDGKRPLVEDNLRWKMTFGGRRPSVKDNLRWILACCLLRFAAFFKTVSIFEGHHNFWGSLHFEGCHILDCHINFSACLHIWRSSSFLEVILSMRQSSFLSKDTIQKQPNLTLTGHLGILNLAEIVYIDHIFFHS